MKFAMQSRVVPSSRLRARSVSYSVRDAQDNNAGNVPRCDDGAQESARVACLDWQVAPCLHPAATYAGRWQLWA